MDHFAGINVERPAEVNASDPEDADQNVTEYFTPENSYSELYSIVPGIDEMLDYGPEPDLEEFDKNLPQTVTLLRSETGAKVYVVGTGHFSVESQNDVSKVMQAVRPHVLVVELCVDRAGVMQMDEETILKEAKDFSLQKLKSIFKEAGVLQGTIYVLLLKLSANLTKNHGMAPGGEFRRALKEMGKLKRCHLMYGDRPLRITIKRALAKLSWWQSISMFFTLLFSKTDISVEEIERYKQKDIVEDMMNKLLEDYPDLSHVLINERDIFLTHSLQTAANKFHIFDKVHLRSSEAIPIRVVGIVGIGHCSGIAKLWGTVNDNDIPPLLVIPQPSKSDIIIKRTLKYSFFCLAIVGVYYVIPFPKSWSSTFRSAYSSLVSKIPLTSKN